MIYFDFLTGKLAFINPIDLDIDQTEQPVVEFGSRNLEGDVILDLGERSNTTSSLIDLKNRV